MAEEQRCEAQTEGHILCANNCGFFGSPATLNLCSKCYRDHCLREEQASSAKFAVEKSLAGPSAAASSTTTKLFSSPALVLPSSLPSSSDLRNLPVVGSSSPAVSASPAVASKPSRCLTCRKRVGLTGFKCKCGITFCSSHRYPEQHGCTFDYKAVGRDAITKANPIVKAEKLENKI